MISNTVITSQPDLCSRYASASFPAIPGISVGDNFVLDAVTYTFITVFGPPASNIVQIIIQGTLDGNVKMLAKAIRGELDISNILYGSGTPDLKYVAYWTSQRFSLGGTVVAAGHNLYIHEINEDLNTVIPISTTSVGASVNGFTRIGFARYVFDGNSSTDPQQSVRGAYQTALPIGSVAIGGVPQAYNVDSIYVLYNDVSTAEAIEIDFYQSADELTFTRVARSATFTGKSYGTLIWEHVNSAIVTAGNGLYMRAGTSGTNPTRVMDFKVEYAI